jgi:RimJ/RimL family protein N-acetyltransferase
VMTVARPADRAGIEAWVRTALENAAAGAEVPFATIDLARGRAVGSTRFMTIVPEHRRLEIGWTWLGTGFQRSGANREAKILQLSHAFEDLGANRVEFKTDSRNERSRAALIGIGATFEGIFRSHMIMPTPPLRDSAFYSVTSAEWPDVKRRLAASLDRP